MVKIIRGTDRTKLDPDMVEHILRVKFNGLPLHMFNAEKYVSEYLNPKDQSKPRNQRCDNPGYGGSTSEDTQPLGDENKDDTTRDFHDSDLLSGRSLIFL